MASPGRPIVIFACGGLRCVCRAFAGATGCPGGQWRWQRQRGLIGGVEDGGGPTYAVSFMYEGWAVAQIVPCIHRGNCPSSWAVAQGPFSAANIYTEPLFLGSCPVRLLGGAEIWLSLKKAAQGSHGRVAILKNSHGPSRMQNCPK